MSVVSSDTQFLMWKRTQDRVKLILRMFIRH